MITKTRLFRSASLAGFFAIAITFLNATVQAQTAQWIKQQGTAGIGNGVSSDTLQNTYVTGMVSNPGLVDNLTIACNASDVFVAKYDPAGSLIWAKTAGGPILDQGYDIATDTSGNSYVVGAIQTNGIYPTVTAEVLSATRRIAQMPSQLMALTASMLPVILRARRRLMVFRSQAPVQMLPMSLLPNITRMVQLNGFTMAAVSMLTLVTP